MTTIVTRQRNRRLRVCREPNRDSEHTSLIPIGYVAYDQLYAWVLRGKEFAVHDFSGDDLTRSVLLDLMTYASDRGTFHVPSERLIQLIKELHPLDPAKTTAQTECLHIQRYAANRRYYARKFGHFSLEKLGRFVAQGRIIVVAARTKRTKADKPGHSQTKAVKRADRDITHHTLTLVLVRLVAKNPKVLGVADLIKLLRHTNNEPV